MTHEVCGNRETSQPRLLEDMPQRTATIQASTFLRCLALHRETFWRHISDRGSIELELFPTRPVPGVSITIIGNLNCFYVFTVYK